MVLPGKYARVERERRFLLAEPPALSSITATRTITDRYLVGTRLRLRRAEWPHGGCELKLTQKVPVAGPGAVQGLITNTYLSPAEYELLASLPAAVLSKTRFRRSTGSIQQLPTVPGAFHPCSTKPGNFWAITPATASGAGAAPLP